MDEKRNGLVDESLQIDTNLIQAARDDHDHAVSVKRNTMTTRIFEQVWNEKIMNSYEKEKLQYLTSDEKTRYFNEKIRELKKYDNYGILNHQDWFLRVVVLDFITGQMQKLVYWFKTCAYNEFDTIYKIVRKLRMLHLDLDAVRSTGEFNVNETNLFQISDDYAKSFTKIDAILNGNTLYELFQNQVKLNFIVYDETSEGNKDSTSQSPIEDKELVKEQQSEIEVQRQLTVRQDIVRANWGSEAALTKVAYERANKNDDEKRELTVKLDESETKTFKSLKGLKNEIIRLKVEGGNDSELKSLLGAFTNQINAMKELMVIEKMNEMNKTATDVVDKKDSTINADVKVN